MFASTETPESRRNTVTLTEVLVVCLLLSLHVQQTVSVPQLGHALGTHGDLEVLAVLHQSVADAVTAADTAGGAGTTRFTRGT